MLLLLYLYKHTLLLLFNVYIFACILYTSANKYMVYLYMTGYGKYCMGASYIVIKVNIIVNSLNILFLRDTFYNNITCVALHAVICSHYCG